MLLLSYHYKIISQSMSTIIKKNASNKIKQKGLVDKSIKNSLQTWIKEFINSGLI